MQATRLFTVLLVSFLVSATADSLTAQTISHVPLYTFYGDDIGHQFGISVSSAGDINGDGRADIIVGDPFNIGNDSESGSVRILSGSDGSILRNFFGDSAGDSFGKSVSGAGDVNGDGTPDLIVGAPNANSNNGSRSGSARVLSGSDGSVLYNFDGNNAFGDFGCSVSDAGDVNGDGFADLIVGAFADHSTGLNIGSARVLSGSNGSVLYNFNGGQDGTSVSGAGDVNGDGFADMIVGTPDGNVIGSARVFSGSDGSVLFYFEGVPHYPFATFASFGASVSGAGDVNGDGFADMIVGAPKHDKDFLGVDSGRAYVQSGSDGSVLYTFDGDSAQNVFGYSVSGAGDVDGDGRADLIVGAPGSGVGGGVESQKGYVRVLSGRYGHVLYTFSGDNEGDRFGVSVSGAGDVNGDGIDDFIVGAAQNNEISTGYARLFVSQICLLGDVNLSGTVDFLDIAPFITVLSNATYQCEADTDGNGVVDFLDIQHFIRLLSW